MLLSQALQREHRHVRLRGLLVCGAKESRIDSAHCDVARIPACEQFHAGGIVLGTEQGRARGIALQPHDATNHGAGVLQDARRLRRQLGARKPCVCRTEK